MAVGAVLFGVGLLATLVTVAPLFVGGNRFPVGFYLVAMLTPVGLALALLGMARGNRARRRPGSRPFPQPPQR